MGREPRRKRRYLREKNTLSFSERQDRRAPSGTWARRSCWECRYPVALRRQFGPSFHASGPKTLCLHGRNRPPPKREGEGAARGRGRQNPLVEELRKGSFLIRFRLRTAIARFAPDPRGPQNPLVTKFSRGLRTSSRAGRRIDFGRECPEASEFPNGLAQTSIIDTHTHTLARLRRHKGGAYNRIIIVRYNGEHDRLDQTGS